MLYKNESRINWGLGITSEDATSTDSLDDAPHDSRDDEPHDSRDDAPHDSRDDAAQFDVCVGCEWAAIWASPYDLWHGDASSKVALEERSVAWQDGLPSLRVHLDGGGLTPFEKEIIIMLTLITLNNYSMSYSIATENSCPRVVGIPILSILQIFNLLDSNPYLGGRIPKHT